MISIHSLNPEQLFSNRKNKELESDVFLKRNKELIVNNNYLTAF